MPDATAEANWKEKYPLLCKPAPRRVRSGAGNTAFRVLALLLIGFGVFIMNSINGSLTTLNRLKRDGKHVTGSVYSHVHHLGKNSYYALKYTYTLAGSQGEGEENVDEAIYYKLKDGDPVNVICLDTNTSRLSNQLAYEIKSYSTTQQLSQYLLIGAALLCEWAARRYGRRQRAMLRFADVTEATLITLGDIPDPQKYKARPVDVTVEYKFKGKKATITLQVLSTECANWAIGRKMPLLVNPSKPEECMLYEEIMDRARLF
jgi:hypothetical protein